MANELELTFSGELANGSLEHTFPAETKQINQGTARLFDNVIPCTTEDTAQSFTNITTLGWCRIKNLGNTHHVDIGPTSSGEIVPFLRLKAGETAYLRLTPGITLRTKADTETVNVHFTVLND